mmetsp:Transcript_16670/g.54279  ORF Transcript_16670/g.54279 Transcript_16670/m.54279 type:complete len:285 (-) Transcript_16670:55-909(-)
MRREAGARGADEVMEAEAELRGEFCEDLVVVVWEFLLEFGEGLVEVGAGAADGDEGSLEEFEGRLFLPGVDAAVEVFDGAEFLLLGAAPEFVPPEELGEGGLDVRVLARLASGDLHEVVPIVGLFGGAARPVLRRFVEHRRLRVVPALALKVRRQRELLLAPKVLTDANPRLLVDAGVRQRTALQRRRRRWAELHVEVRPVVEPLLHHRVQRQRLPHVRLEPQVRHLELVLGVLGVVVLHEALQQLPHRSVLPLLRQRDLQRLVQRTRRRLLVVNEHLHRRSGR